MSHVAEQSEFVISDLEDLAEAAKECGLTLKQHQTTHKWYGRWMDDWKDQRAAANTRDPKTFGTCTHALVLTDATKDDYEIGLVENPNGEGYVPVYDTWGPGRRLEKQAGHSLRKLKAKYEERHATKQLRKRGFTVQRTLDEKGRVHLVGVKR